MATTNFLIFDPGYANAENDTAYLGDASRAGGLDVNAILTSSLLNKVLIQLSQMVSAIAVMLQNKGFSTSDSNFSALVSALSNIVTTADAKAGILGMVYSPTANFNMSLNAAFTMTLTGNLTSPTFSGFVPGTTVTFAWQQDAVGGRTVTYGGSFYTPGPAQPDPTPLAVSLQSFICLTDGIFRRNTGGVYHFCYQGPGRRVRQIHYDRFAS